MTRITAQGKRAFLLQMKCFRRSQQIAICAASKRAWEQGKTRKNTSDKLWAAYQRKSLSVSTKQWMGHWTCAAGMFPSHRLDHRNPEDENREQALRFISAEFNPPSSSPQESAGNTVSPATSCPPPSPPIHSSARPLHSAASQDHLEINSCWSSHSIYFQKHQRWWTKSWQQGLHYTLTMSE